MPFFFVPIFAGNVSPFFGRNSGRNSNCLLVRVRGRKTLCPFVGTEETPGPLGACRRGPLQRLRASIPGCLFACHFSVTSRMRILVVRKFTPCPRDGGCLHFGFWRAWGAFRWAQQARLRPTHPSKTPGGVGGSEFQPCSACRHTRFFARPRATGLLARRMALPYGASTATVTLPLSHAEPQAVRSRRFHDLQVAFATTMAEKGLNVRETQTAHAPQLTVHDLAILHRRGRQEAHPEGERDLRDVLRGTGGCRVTSEPSRTEQSRTEPSR